MNNVPEKTTALLEKLCTGIFFLSILPISFRQFETLIMAIARDLYYPILMLPICGWFRLAMGWRTGYKLFFCFRF